MTPDPDRAVRTPRTDMCVHCQQRPAALNWVADGGVLAWTHGMSQRWCERCATAAQLEHARKMAAQIPDLEQKLRTP